MSSPEIKRLARRLDSLERQARQRKLPTLGHSSIDGGALQANDDDGVLTLIVGQQFDGTNTAAVVTGPPPPQPLLPMVTEQAGSLRIFWDGTFTDGAVAPMDFARVLAYAAPMASFVAPDPLDHTVIVGQFASATGGEITAALDPGVEYVVYLVTWTQAGKFGPASDVVTATPTVVVGQADLDAIDAAVDAAQSDATQALADAATADQKAVDAATTAAQAASDAAAADAAATQAASDAAAADTKADQAAADAAAADSKADQAASDAAAALGIAEDKGLVLIQSTTPTVDQQTPTTLWIDTTGGANTPKQWDGTAWVTVQDADIQAAADTAAQAAADAAAADAKADQAAADAAAADAKADQAASDAAAADAKADAAQSDATQAINDAQAAGDLAGQKSAVYRDPARPWEDGDATHADDAGDLWFDTTLQPGDEVPVSTWEATGGVVTITTNGDHNIETGMTVTLVGVEPTVLDVNTFVVTGVPTTSSLTFSAAVADTAVTETTDATIQALDAVPLNRPYLWSGTAWVSAQDSGISAAASLANGVAVQVSTQGEEIEQTQAELATVRQTATDAYGTAYAADGRVSISDYEPGPNDIEGKNDGSLWITRTRDRINYCTNTSFEADLSDWAVTGGTGARVAVVPAGDGGYAMQVTNDATAGPHLASWAGGAPGLPVSAGQDWTVSGYVQMVSGLGSGAFAEVEFFDAGGASLGAVTGEPIDLLDTEWTRLYVTTVVPDLATHMVSRFSVPAASAVWNLDAIVVEANDTLGRYFDADSEGGSLNEDGTASLDGGAIIRLFTLEDGGWSEKFWTADTIKSVDASVIDRGQMNGGFIADNSIPTDKQFAELIEAQTAIAAGDLVNIFSLGGVPVVRPARADVRGQEAHGFVLEAAAIGESVRVYTSGYNPLLSDLTPGACYLSSTPGKSSSQPPSRAGRSVQRVGFAPTSTTLNFSAGDPVWIT